MRFLRADYWRRDSFWKAIFISIEDDLPHFRSGIRRSRSVGEGVGGALLYTLFGEGGLWILVFLLFDSKIHSINVSHVLAETLFL